MITIEEIAHVDADGRLTLSVPPSVAPGEHRVVLSIDEAARPIADEVTQDDPIYRLADLAEPMGSLTNGDIDRLVYGG